jgi:DNA-binding response OmpR family regulator
MRILLVDDEKAFLFILGEILRTNGYAVTPAEDGQEAKALLDRGTYDLVISDVYMPRIDGFQLHAYVRSTAAHAQVPFIFLTGADHQETRTIARDRRRDAVLVKTAPVEEIVACIEKLRAA